VVAILVKSVVKCVWKNKPKGMKMAKSKIRQAYDKVMGTTKKGGGDPTIGKAAGIIKGREESTQAAIDKALGQTGSRSDLKDTGAGW
jgi:hypothetical protein